MKQQCFSFYVCFVFWLFLQCPVCAPAICWRVSVMSIAAVIHIVKQKSHILQHVWFRNWCKFIVLLNIILLHFRIGRGDRITSSEVSSTEQSVCLVVLNVLFVFSVNNPLCSQQAAVYSLNVTNSSTQRTFTLTDQVSPDVFCIQTANCKWYCGAKEANRN